MARKLAILLGLFFLYSLSARAQGVEVFGGYSYERYQGSPASNLSGIEVSGQYKFTNWIGAAADFDGHYGSPGGIHSRTLHFMVGPQMSLPSRVSPFVHVLVGVGHVYVGGATNNSFATAVGGGIDTRIAPLVSWRIIQADAVIENFFGGTQHSARLSTGLVFRF